MPSEECAIGWLAIMVLWSTGYRVTQSTLGDYRGHLESGLPVVWSAMELG